MKHNFGGTIFKEDQILKLLEILETFILKKIPQICVDLRLINMKEFLQAMQANCVNTTQIRTPLASALTDKSNDPKMFMKNIRLLMLL